MSSVMTISMFGWKLIFDPVSFSVVRPQLDRRLRKIDWMTRIRVCTSSQLTDSHVPWAARPCYNQHSNTHPAGLMAIVAIREVHLRYAGAFIARKGGSNVRA